MRDQVSKEFKYSYWKYREASKVNKRKMLGLSMLIVAGFISVLFFAEWWFREEHINSLPLYLVLTFIFWWGIFRMVILWVSYIKITKPAPVPASEDLRVAIFTTSSPGEPLSMFEKTLEACAKITYPHTTYLLDDTRDPRFRETAEKHGAVWLELVGFPGAKAGKINAALQRTTEDFILVLDPDHIPFPNFLDEVLGFFKDKKVGYVQVAQAYYNQYRSFTARGAAEQTYGFYGPTQMALEGINCAVAIGANCTFRRKALESIGGHGIGLAEDMVTAIRIHSRGWRSVYNPVVVSRGLVPEDLGSFCKQQLKWARGVHEVLFAELPKLWKHLSGWQRLSYFTIGTYYSSGFTMFLFLIIPYLFLWFGWLPANMEFSSFVINWTPLAIFGLAIYLYVQNWLCHREEERGLHWRGMVLKFACWPVFLMGFVLAIFNRDIPYIPTAKQAVKGFTPFVRPLFLFAFLFLGTIIYILISRKFYTAEAGLFLTSGEIWGMVAFATIAFIMTIMGIYAAWESRNLSAEEPWKYIEVNKIDISGKHHKTKERKEVTSV
ncbi:glycosyltransferase family 2 protein [Salinimicrobium xinjiangense]|uniref:glycosyltransferase family 2 protein n=1 Tax=Salinimicrobium xinjiangense TaxID=438596 RepID=UPI0006866B4F|nr:cellulose synthase catalytic subunit [Salinimicrobium xinjiangense]